MRTKTIKTQFGKSAAADLEDNTWTFQMNEPARVVSGDFAIVDKLVYDELLSNARNLIYACRGNGMSIDGAVNDLIETIYKTNEDFNPMEP